ncbi:efflux RND transporter periplasmic adaptor subunit [Tanticharoenia sakaeratensis]|uniref:Membrane fusion protein MtrC n=1 Tax=Tanticharoenia sakaeratensis NBRC 103193 TaxID=1231623 RepID=A0A0D6MKG3_9PROT|nr:efflux RND transporter periplasmic adaptor subunit [Tanticharoenia sakaeratensis]GAN53966.1 membrane fusion protein MtrC [Tanticharoenia sakaeratensis NBRC 103193]GBQ23544.1 membrane-fusion protein [Tanticharoenia sakaeratensis NBRC 103193]
MSEPTSFHIPDDRRSVGLGPFLGLGLIVAIGYGLYAHVERGAATRALAMERQTLVPDVRTMRVHAAADPVMLDLPGETAPQETAAIGARASGYIEKRFVDIGSVVKAGQVLAIIRAPELDAQVARAQAALAQARANLNLAKVTARRSSSLVGNGAVSKQNFDVDRITQSARDAEQKAADAAYAETAQRQAYTTLTAPFDGVVTVRNVEVGDLVSADSAGAMPLFVVARTDRLRVRVHVPQEEAHAIAVGTTGTVTVPGRAGQGFDGVVARTGHALERDSRMLPVEIELDNRDGRLAAGLYASVHFALKRDAGAIVIPSEALSYEADGLSVETVSPDNRIQVRHVSVGRDFGAAIEVTGGLPDGSQLVVHPASSLHDGSKVAPRLDPQTAAGAGG